MSTTPRTEVKEPQIISSSSCVSLTEERMTTPDGKRIKLIKKKIVKTRNDGTTARTMSRDVTKSQISFNLTEHSEHGFLTMR